MGVFFEWMRKIASKGVAILLVHHENKTGQHRGTGKITDDVDLVISLKSIDRTSTQNNSIKVDIEDSRYLFGDACNPFTLEYGVVERTITTNEKPKNAGQQIFPPEKIDSKSFVSEEEIEANELDQIHIDILTKLRSGEYKFVTNSTITKDRRYKRGSVTKAFEHLVAKGLLRKDGKNKGTKYCLKKISDQIQ